MLWCDYKVEELGRNYPEIGFRNVGGDTMNFGVKAGVDGAGCRWARDGNVRLAM
jgi:hypothetical protein